MKNTFTVSDTMHVTAPIERCFLLSTNVELVAETLKMKAVDGRRRGLIERGDQILWAGWKFGLPQMHESKITAYDRPEYFQDTMVHGRFHFYQHDHTFTEIGGHTLLQDKVRFSLPLGPVGALVAEYVMVPYIARMIHKRFVLLKRLVEGDGWKKYLPEQ